MKFVKKIAFLSLFALILVMALATIVEKFFGTETALAKVYNAWWFVALWSLCAVSAAVVLVKYLPLFLPNQKSSDQKKLPVKPAMTASTLLVHIAFLLILAGAFTSFLTSKRGFVHIRQGEILNYFLVPKANGETVRENLPFNVKLLMFSKTPLDVDQIAGHTSTSPDNPLVESNRNKKGDFFSYLQIDGEMCCVWLNHIYKHRNFRFYQYEYDSDEQGVTLLVNRDPAGIAITYAGYLLLLVSGLWLLIRKLRWKGMLYLAVPTAAVWLFISQIKPMTPVLRSPMLAAHVSVIMVAYVLLLAIAIISAVALIRESKAKNQETRQNNFQFSILNSKLLLPAIFLLAFGIFIGAVWANISWGRYWGWDSKETWALITLLVYAVPFHKKTFPKFQEPKFFHKYLLFAFLSVLMTFLGVSFLLGGMHSYL
ncbi:MAG: cytochrome c biogenesis protein CcsA [Prevotellaceae bacterium]|jgi:hypothetical protein|nr:cytochrome c biogenesis protein CcsA [Prevotellaceae bacterium]